MADFVGGLLGLIILGGMLGFIYKYRAEVKKWLEKPDYGDFRSWDIPRITKAQRRIIKAQWKLDDEQAYLAYLESEEAKKAETVEGK